MGSVFQQQTRIFLSSAVKNVVKSDCDDWVFSWLRGKFRVMRRRISPANMHQGAKWKWWSKTFWKRVCLFSELYFFERQTVRVGANRFHGQILLFQLQQWGRSSSCQRHNANPPSVVNGWNVEFSKRSLAFVLRFWGSSVKTSREGQDSKVNIILCGSDKGGVFTG